MSMVIKSPRIAAGLVITAGLLAGFSAATGKTLSTVQTPEKIIKISAVTPDNTEIIRITPLAAKVPNLRE